MTSAASAKSTDQIGRVPPHSDGAERAILGGLLLDPDAAARVVEVLQAGDFYDGRNRLIYRAVLGLFEHNRPADWETVTEVLRSWQRIEQAGGTAYLVDLVDAVPTAANVMHYVQVVRDYAVQRRLLGACREIEAECYQGLPEDMSEFLGSAEQRVFAIGEALIENRAVTARELMASSLEAAERLYERKENITGIPSGFQDLDKLTAGFQPSDLIIIAGRPSMGKTAFALNVAMHAAQTLGSGLAFCSSPPVRDAQEQKARPDPRTTVAVFSLEMSKEQLGMRLLCSVARVNLNNLRTGFLSDHDWGRIVTAVGAIAEAPLVIDDTPAIGTLEIRAKARRIMREHGLAMIVVDYLQLMQSSRRSDSREREISEISRSLKTLAKELHVPVIALSQLNRKVEERPDKRPHLADLRESGAIEQDADVILFIYRDEVYNDSPDNPKRGLAEIIIGKQRNGPVGKVEVQFDHPTTTFRALARRQEEDEPQMGAL